MAMRSVWGYLQKATYLKSQTPSQTKQSNSNLKLSSKALITSTTRYTRIKYPPKILQRPYLHPPTQTESHHKFNNNSR